MAESGRIYSSVHDNDAPGTGHAQSMLDSAQAWSPQGSAIGQWMQIDLGIVVTAYGIVTQGRKPESCPCSQWVTTYTVALSLDGLSWEDLGTTFTGNGDRDTRVVGAFSTRREARYVRILPQSWNEWLSMRAGVLLCEARRPHRLFGNKHI